MVHQIVSQFTLLHATSQSNWPKNADGCILYANTDDWRQLTPTTGAGIFNAA